MSTGLFRQIHIDRRLFESCQAGDMQTAQALIKIGADVNYYCRKTKESCLTASVKHINIIELLLKHGADVDFKNQYGNNALSLATFYKNVRVVELLLNNNSILTGKNIYSKNVFDILQQEAGKNDKYKYFIIKKLLHLHSNGFTIYQSIHNVFLALNKEKIITKQYIKALKAAAMNNFKQSDCFHISRLISYITHDPDNIVSRICHNIKDNNLELIKSIISSATNEHYKTVAEILDGVLIYSLYFSTTDTFMHLLNFMDDDNNYLFYNSLNYKLICIAIYAKKYQIALDILENIAEHLDEPDFLKILYSLSNSNCKFYDKHSIDIKKILIDKIKPKSRTDLFLYIDNENMFKEFIYFKIPSDSRDWLLTPIPSSIISKLYNKNISLTKLLHYGIILRKHQLINYALDSVNIKPNKHLIKCALMEENNKVFYAICKINTQFVLDNTKFEPYELRLIVPAICTYLNFLSNLDNNSEEQIHSLVCSSRSILLIKYCIDMKYLSVESGLNILIQNISDFQVHFENLKNTKYLFKLIKKFYNDEKCLKVYVEDIQSYLFVKRFIKYNNEINMKLDLTSRKISEKNTILEYFYGLKIKEKAENFEHYVSETRKCYFSQKDTLFFRCAERIGKIYSDKYIKENLPNSVSEQVLCIKSMKLL